MWNYNQFFKESKVQEEIMNVEKELNKQQNINFESAFSNSSTSFQDAIKLAIQKVFKENNLNFEYDPIIHQFLRKTRKDVTTIASFLNSAEAAKIRAVMRAMKQEKIQSVVDKITDDYNRDFAPKGVSKQEFSYVLQATVINDDIKSAVDKVGEEAVIKEQSSFKNTIRDLTNPHSGAWTTLLFGKINPELKEKIQENTEPNTILEEFQMREGEVKQEVLMASEFSPMVYPLKPENYWPPLKTDYAGVMEEKILETFDITDPTSVIKGIMSAKLGTVAMTEEANRIRVLYKNKFNSDTDKFFKYLTDVFIKDGNPEETIDNYINEIKNGIVGGDRAKDERKRDTIFPEMESYFDSIKEKEIVDLVRDEFYLTCVASAMEFPITNDFTMNKKNFITDFVIYCDGFDGFKEQEQDGVKYEVPVIKQRLLLIGEYYGYYSDLKSKPLQQDLINPDGTPFLKDDGNPALAGDVLTIGEEYKFKTKYKIITNDFCGKAIGCKTISVNQANSRKEQRSQVAKGLEQNRVIYNSASTDVEIKSMALIELIDWYRKAPDVAKDASKSILSKYFDTETLQKKSGKEYPLSFQNPKSKYLGLIYETTALLKSKYLSAAILQSKALYSSKTIQNDEAGREYLRNIAPIRDALAEQNAWRMSSLADLYRQIQNIPIENGKLAKPINNIEFLNFINDIKNLSKTNVSTDNILMKNAFNFYKSIKRGIIS